MSIQRGYTIIQCRISETTKIPIGVAIWDERDRWYFIRMPREGEKVVGISSP